MPKRKMLRKPWPKKVRWLKIKPPGEVPEKWELIPWPPEKPEHWSLLGRYLIWANDKLQRACVCQPGPGDDPAKGGGMDGGG